MVFFGQSPVRLEMHHQHGPTEVLLDDCGICDFCSAGLKEHHTVDCWPVLRHEAERRKGPPCSSMP